MYSFGENMEETKNTLNTVIRASADAVDHLRRIPTRLGVLCVIGQGMRRCCGRLSRPCPPPTHTADDFCHIFCSHVLFHALPISLPP